VQSELGARSREVQGVERRESTKLPKEAKEKVKENSRTRAGRKTLDSCAVLGASPEDDLLTIRTQYRRVALSHHPDKGGSKQAFVRLQGAKDYMIARNAEQTEVANKKAPTASTFRHAASMQFGGSESEGEGDSQGLIQSMPTQLEHPRPNSAYKTRQLETSPGAELAQREAKPPRHLSIPEDQSQDSDESDCRKVMGGTMSTECPPSRRQTRSSIDSQDLFLEAEHFDRQEAAQDLASSTEGDVVVSQPQRRGSTLVSNRSLEAVSSAASHLGKVAHSRKALEQEVRIRLREMDHHCEAITETYRQLAALHGEIGEVFLDLRYAWAPLHCEKDEDMH